MADDTPQPTLAAPAALDIEDMDIQPLSRELLTEMLAAIGSNGQHCCSHTQCSNKGDKLAELQALTGDVAADEA